MYSEILIKDDLPYAPEISGEQENSSRNPVFEKLAAEGGENYFDYVKLLGLDKDPRLIALSSFHHYYWDAEDLQEIRTLVNLKQLNQIKRIGDFLMTINNVLPHQGYFIGSFTESKDLNAFTTSNIESRNRAMESNETIGNGISFSHSVFNIINNILDVKTNRFLSKITVKQLLESAGLEVLDMTQLNGLTYFCTDKVRAIA
jgi:hypothetical protein